MVLASAVRRVWLRKVFSVRTSGASVRSNCHLFLLHCITFFPTFICLSVIVRCCPVLSVVRPGFQVTPRKEVRPEGSITPFGGQVLCHLNQASGVQAWERGVGSWWACGPNPCPHRLGDVGVVDAAQLGRVGPSVTCALTGVGWVSAVQGCDCVIHV